MSDLENQILKQVQESIHETIKNRLTIGYGDAPLNKLIDSVVQDNSEELRKLVGDSFTAAIRQDDFKSELKTAFNHKLARVLVSKFEGEIEKRANEMRADPTTRARITLAIQAAIENP